MNSSYNHNIYDQVLKHKAKVSSLQNLTSLNIAMLELSDIDVVKICNGDYGTRTKYHKACIKKCKAIAKKRNLL